MKYFLIFLLTGCSVLPHRKEETVIPLVEELAGTYRSLQAPGWTDTAECDALLFNSLRAASGIPVNPGEAQDPAVPGRWYRRPVSLPECYASGESVSTISRDMLLGVYWWAWSTDNTQVVRDLWEYASSRSWFTGDGQNGGATTLLNSNMVSLLARLCVDLDAGCSGNVGQWAKTPLTFTGIPEGYVRHLEVLQILLLGEIDGQIPGYLADRLRLHAEQQPDNPLFSSSMVLYNRWNTGEVDADLSEWPTDRLPNSSDWCSSWRTEAEGGSRGWGPCPGDTEVHSGGEIIFLSRILHGKN